MSGVCAERQKRQRIETQLDKLDKLNERRAELGEELRLSLALQALWPDVFKHGKAYSHAEGSRGRGYELVVRDGAGAVRRFPLEDVPLVLWPAHLKHSRAGDTVYERMRAGRAS